MKKQFTKFGLLFLCWTFLAIFLSLARSLYRITVGRPADFLHFLPLVLLDYWLWVALTPLIFYLARRFQFTRQTWLRSIAIHFCGYLGVGFLHEAASHLLRLPISVPDGFTGSVFMLRLVAALYEDLWMYWPIVVVWSMVEYYQRYRERDLRATRLSEQLARAELQALRNQLHPHFLFNTLNSIAALIHRDTDAADDMLADLGRLLRAYLVGEPEQEIRLGRELELLNTYIRIQQRRFQDRLSWSTDVPEDLLDAVVPALLLQPLVENAILHGIAPRPGPGQVHVAARRQGFTLRLEVSDDGVGLDPTYKEGLALANTRSRLKQLYGNQQSLDLAINGTTGALVRVILPLRFLATDRAGRDETVDGDHRKRVGGQVEDAVATTARV